MTLEAVGERPNRPHSWTEVMENLKGQVGNLVSIRYASDGSQGIRRGILVEVKPFESVTIDDFEIPFIGRRAAIQQIIGDEILYRLPIISDMYGDRREKDVIELRKCVFGTEDRTAEETLAF